MLILGIETSCDETAIASLEVKDGNFKILSNVVSSQVKVHRKWGGVVPNLAKREHQKNLTFVLKRALEEAKVLKNPKSKIQNPKLQSKIQNLKKILEREPVLFKRVTTFLQKYEEPKIDLISVVNGPGLEPALWTGVNFAKALAYYWEKTIVSVNHLEGHLLTNFIGDNFQFSISNFQNIFPAICLLVSGGHTMLVLMEGVGKYKIIGETRDDSAGECFDKTARILGLGYPGGPAIAKAVKKALPPYRMRIKLPRPMIYSKDYDFSFSGLKTAVLYHYQAQPLSVRKSKNYVFAMAAEIQQAIVDVLITKTIRAAKEYKAKTIMIGGGVAANYQLREQLRQKLEEELPKVQYIAPDPKLCTDNGVMAAVAGYFAWKKLGQQGIHWQNIKAEANMKL